MSAGNRGRSERARRGRERRPHVRLQTERNLFFPFFFSANDADRLLFSFFFLSPLKTKNHAGRRCCSDAATESSLFFFSRRWRSEERDRDSSKERDSSCSSCFCLCRGSGAFSFDVASVVAAATLAPAPQTPPGRPSTALPHHRAEARLRQAILRGIPLLQLGRERRRGRRRGSSGGSSSDERFVSVCAAAAATAAAAPRRGGQRLCPLRLGQEQLYFFRSGGRRRRCAQPHLRGGRLTSRGLFRLGHEAERGGAVCRSDGGQSRRLTLRARRAGVPGAARGWRRLRVPSGWWE